jgi:thiamine-phosphate pyrophosphorylase
MADAKPKCRLYLKVPAPLTAKLEAQLTQALETTSVACVLLCDDGQPIDEIHGDRLLTLVQKAGTACLIENDIMLAERLGADGVHIHADPELYTAARAQLGESANIGAGCGFARHDAMRLAEMGADYVAFGPDAPDSGAIDQCAELTSWWSEIFVIPSVGWNIADAEQAARLADLGADFIAPPKTIWQDDNALAILGDIDHAISRVRRTA